MQYPVGLRSPAVATTTAGLRSFRESAASAFPTHARPGTHKGVGGRGSLRICKSPSHAREKWGAGRRLGRHSSLRTRLPGDTGRALAKFE